ncbi:MAG: colicin-like pore-forming protein [Promethearchaeota archaeon]
MNEEGEEKENFIARLNKSFTDFFGNIFGESGREFIEETSEKIKDFSSEAIKKIMEFSDDAIEKLNLKENEQVIKARDSIEDVLKQAGLLKEDKEEEEF